MLIGIVGKANVGKSTFFKAATLAEVLIANYPFATIKANHGVGYVKVDCVDKFFGVQCNPRQGFCINHKRFVPIELLDVAGLVPGAHEGKGLGNKFLDDLRQADVLIHIIDVSGTTDEEGKPTTGYDPSNDVIFLQDELDYWYFGILNKVWHQIIRKVEVEHVELYKLISKQLSGLKVDDDMVKKTLSKLNYDKPSSWSNKQVFNLARELRRLNKPMIIVANKVDLVKGKENFQMLKEKFPDEIIIPSSAEYELALRQAAKSGLITYIPGEDHFKINKINEINEKQKQILEKIQSFLNGWHSTGVQDALNKAVFGLLHYIYVFPGGVNNLTDKDGNVLPDCFLMPPDSKAIDFAYKIHKDLGDNFIKAIDVKTKMVIGRYHELKPGDAIEIVAKA